MFRTGVWCLIAQIIFYSVFLFGCVSALRADISKTTIDVVVWDTIPFVSISGKVQYYSNNAPIKDANLTMSGKISLSKHSDSNGNYEFTDLVINENYTVKPSKLSDTDIGAFTIISYDAALTARAAVELEQLTDYEAIAANVNRDDVISAYDAALIAQYAVGIPKNSFSHVGEWDFLPDSIAYQPLESGSVGDNYIGIILGNVHGEWFQPSGLKKKRIIKTKYNKLKDISACPGEEIVIPLDVESEQMIISADIDFRYDSDVLRFIEISRTELTQNFEVVLNDEPGRLRIGLYSIEPMEKDGRLVNIKFKVSRKTAETTTLSLNKYQLNNTELMKSNALLTIIKGSELPTKYSLGQNYPNPLFVDGGNAQFRNQQTFIDYQIPHEQKVFLTIYNFLGQKVRSLVRGIKKRGYHQVVWDGRNDNGALVSGGTYFYRFVAGDYVNVRKMIVLR